MSDYNFACISSKTVATQSGLLSRVDRARTPARLEDALTLREYHRRKKQRREFLFNWRRYAPRIVARIRDERGREWGNIFPSGATRAKSIKSRYRCVRCALRRTLRGSFRASPVNFPENRHSGLFRRPRKVRLSLSPSSARRLCTNSRTRTCRFVLPDFHDRTFAPGNKR